MPARRRRSQLPFLPLAPAVVVVLGVTVAVAIALLGASDLRSQSDEAAALRSQALSLALAERLRASPAPHRPAMVERAARRSGAEVLLVGTRGEIAVDATLAPPTQNQIAGLLQQGQGQATTRLGRTRFFVAPLAPPLDWLSVVTFVPAPETPYAIRTLASSVGALTALLIGAAALVAFALARAVHTDVDAMQKRIVQMASAGANPAGEPVPVRAVDQTGSLATAFNRLVERFGRAEEAYQRDLDRALAYDRDRSEFLAALSHELRTPLNAILGFADVLMSEVDGPLSPESRENLAVVRSSGDHLRSLIDDILDLSALESGKLRLSAQQVDLFVIASEVIREARLMVQDRPLTVELQGEATSIWADARRIRQILTNVVNNAIKFTREGSVVLDIASPREEVALVTITDTGRGIAPDDLGSIFEEFRQTRESQATRVGTGLGLAITRRLVTMHNGAIWVESELGKGSRFFIALPRRPGLLVEHEGGATTRISRVSVPPPEDAE